MLYLWCVRVPQQCDDEQVTSQPILASFGQHYPGSATYCWSTKAIMTASWFVVPQTADSSSDRTPLPDGQDRNHGIITSTRRIKLIAYFNFLTLYNRNNNLCWP